MWLLLLLLWMIMNGRVTVELIIFGVIIASAVTYFAYKAVGYTPAEDLRILRNLPVFLLYILDLLYEIIKAACTVSGMVFEAQEPDPVIIEFHSGFETRLQNALLANSITLTPGTITVFQEGDRFVVHCLRKEYAEGMEDSSFVRVLRKIK